MEPPKLILVATVGFQASTLVAMAVLTFVLEAVDVMTMTYVVVAVGILSGIPLTYAIHRMQADAGAA